MMRKRKKKEDYGLKNLPNISVLMLKTPQLLMPQMTMKMIQVIQKKTMTLMKMKMPRMEMKMMKKVVMMKEEDYGLKNLPNILVVTMLMPNKLIQQKMQKKIQKQKEMMVKMKKAMMMRKRKKKGDYGLKNLPNTLVVTM